MQLIKIFFGLLAMIVAWAYVFRSKLIFYVNAWMREFVFSDQVVLFSGRRVAMLLLILGGVALFSGIQGVVQVQTIKPNIAAKILEQAKDDFRLGHHTKVINRCRILVRANPQNVEAWELLANSYWAIGEKEQSHRAVESLLRIDPNHPLGKGILGEDIDKRNIGVK